jgi:predicted thioesterase
MAVNLSAGAKTWAGVTANVSRGGLSVHSDFVLPPGSAIAASFQLPSGEPVRVRAEVQWARKLQGKATLEAQNSMGLRFTTAAGGAYQAFIRVLEQAAAAQSMVTRAAREADRGTVAPPRPAAAAPGRVTSHLYGTGTLPAVGLEALMELVVGPSDLAAPGGYPCSIAPSRAAWMIEQACTRLLAPLLAGRTKSVGVGLAVNTQQGTPIPVDTRLVITAQLASLSPDGRSAGFEVAITDGDHVVASGKHTRLLVEPAAK